MNDTKITPEVANLMAATMGLAASCQTHNIHAAYKPHLGTMEISIYPLGYEYAIAPTPHDATHYVVWLDEDEAAGELRIISEHIASLTIEVAA